VNSRKKKLIEIMGEGSVYDDPETLSSYSRDESFSLPMNPSFVVKPGDGAKVEEIVHWANRTRTGLIPVSSGPPRFRGDTVPSAPDSVVVDLSGMKKIIRIDRRNRMALIEPGVTFAEIQPALAKEGLRLSTPLLPRANKSVVASLLEREPSIIPKHQWAFLDPLRCVEVVWGDGNRLMTGEAGNAGTLTDEWKMGLAQVAAAGPAQTNFYKLLSAAQGTMGIATWASVKCQVLPSVQRLFFVPSERIDCLIDLAYRLLRLRFGDELLLLNGLDIASILENESLKIRTLSEKLPSWILMVGVAGRDILPNERVEFQEKDITEIAQQFGLQLLSSFPGAEAGEMLDALLHPSKEPYWKLSNKGGCQDIFFLTTLDRAPGFINTMASVAEACGFPSSEIGVYIQPVHQGVCCHCEFSLPFDPDNGQEATRIRELFQKASEELSRQGAFFSRPYGMWAGMAFNRDGQTTSVLKKLKKIFDPKGVMNPGKLCF
jgi:FAD/FMN-containing dehydrogenase